MPLQKILFVNNSSKLGIGTSVSLLLLLKYLHKEYECAVVSDKHSFQLPASLGKYGIRHYALPDRVIFYLPLLVYVILRGGYDLIYANGSNERSRGAFWAAKITRRPMIWHIRESLRRKKYAGTIRFADRVIANSNDTADRLRKYAHVPNPHVIPNGIEIQDFNLNVKLARIKLGNILGLEPDWIRVINVGMICPRKNQADVISVAREIVAHFPRIYFIMVGAAEKEYLCELKKEVEKHDLCQNVIFCDNTPEIAYYICGSNIMLHTATREPQGRVILEAMSARLPVVVYNVGGVGEAILDKETGFLLPFGDLNGLVQAVCRLIIDPNERVQMGNAGYKRVKEHFSVENTTQAIREVIRQVLGKK